MFCGIIVSLIFTVVIGIISYSQIDSILYCEKDMLDCFKFWSLVYETQLNIKFCNGICKWNVICKFISWLLLTFWYFIVQVMLDCCRLWKSTESCFYYSTVSWVALDQMFKLSNILFIFYFMEFLEVHNIVLQSNPGMFYYFTVV